MANKSKVSPTLKVLLEMRDELRGLTGRMDALTGRVDALESALRGLAPAILDTLKLLRQRDDLRGRVDDHERRLTSLERHAG